MSVSEEVASAVLAKCGRCCCICRRYRPTLLQVHHIVEASKGGSDNEDNVIALCITCHSDVHTLRPFTRRFTPDELKSHKDAVYALVAAGKLVPEEDNVATLPNLSNSEIPHSTATSITSLSSVAIELLCCAAEDKAAGHIMIIGHMAGVDVQAGKLKKSVGHGRGEAQFIAAAEELEDLGYATRTPTDHYKGWRLTYEGYLAADELGSSLAHDKNSK